MIPAQSETSAAASEVVSEVVSEAAVTCEVQPSAAPDPDRWRRLYETEAQQRRSEVQALQAQVAQLKAELSLRQTLSEPDPNRLGRLQQHVSRIQDPAKLQRLLLEAGTECERLRLALAQERDAHRHTRDRLTATLVDTLAQLRDQQAPPNA